MNKELNSIGIDKKPEDTTVVVAMSENEEHDLKAWKLIDDAGMRGATFGGAKISEKHSNFLINSGGATAYELESLGEQVRKSVFKTSKVKLEWELIRIGETNQ